MGYINMKFVLIALAAAVNLEWDSRTDCNTCKWVSSACVSWNEADGKFCRQNEGTRAGICGDKGRYNQATCETVFPIAPSPMLSLSPKVMRSPSPRKNKKLLMPLLSLRKPRRRKLNPLKPRLRNEVQNLTIPPMPLKTELL